MTTQEMINAFLLEYDLNGSAAVGGFEDSEIIALLNKAQINVVKKLYNESRGDNLQILVNTVSSEELILEESEYQNNNAYRATLPNNYLFFLNARCLVTRTGLPTIAIPSWVETMVINKEESSKFVTSSANRTIFYNPVIFESSNKFIVITDSLTTIEPINLVGITNNFVITYIRYPLTLAIDNTCELEVIWHQNIVDEAVYNAMKIVNDSRIK